MDPRRHDHFVPGFSSELRQGDNTFYGTDRRGSFDRQGGTSNSRPISQPRTLDGGFDGAGFEGGQRFAIPRDGYDPASDSGFSRGGLPASGETEFGTRLLQADRPVPAEPDFDWSQKSTSVADLQFPARTAFRHNQDFLSSQEEAAYLDLIDTAALQWRLLLQQTLQDRGAGKNPQAAWEEAFYRFAEIRRMAWNNGLLRDGKNPQTIGGLLDPFRSAAAAVPVDDPNAVYRVLDDVARFPDVFVGRPIVLYGRFRPGSEVRLRPTRQSAEAGIGAEAESYFPGLPDSLLSDVSVDGRSLPPVRAEQKLLRGTLLALSGTQQLATVDTKRAVDSW